MSPPKGPMWGLFRRGARTADTPAGDRRRAQELVDRGIAAEGAGNAALTLESFREAIKADPRFALAHMNLGIAQHAGGELAAAIVSHRQAIALDPGSAAAHYNLALAYLETGQAVQAEAAFREALRLGVAFPEAWVGLADALEALGRDQGALAALDTAIGQREHFLGAQFNASVLLRKMGQPEAAEARLRKIELGALYSLPDRHAELESVARQMIQVWPDYALGWRALGTVLALRQRFEEAVPALHKALAGLPSDAEIHNTLGAALHALGRSSEAEASIRRALQLQPGYYEAHINLGRILLVLGRPAEAESSLRRALELKPEDSEAHNTLGVFLQEQGRPSEAEQSYRRALEIKPDSHFAHFNLGIALQQLARLPEAELSFRRAIELKPDAYQAHTNLANVLQALRRFSEAEASYRRALAIEPGSEATHSNLGSALRELGRMDEAESSFRRALELDPDIHEARSNLLFTLNCMDRLSLAEMFHEHLAWGLQHEAPLVRQRQGHRNSREIRRRLRIGYVSPDFRRHSVAYFIEPVLAGHRRDAFEVFCYSNVVTPDRMTERLLGLADSSRNIAAMSDARAAELIRSDGIDILVDLAGHTAKGRLGLFALKPAPVQVGYLGYPNTSGIGAMDWRLTDFHADPPGEGDRFYSEKIARLPDSFLCFLPPDEAPLVYPPPNLRNGYITFGSFNVLSKITPGVIATWAHLLERIPRSRLLLKAAGLSDPGAHERLAREFAQHGIDQDRLAFFPMDNDLRNHLARYHEVDVGLDPFPYNGTTTTLEALWMGVPVISIAGDRHSARVGASILANLGLDNLVAKNVEDYQAIAVDLASDRTQLASLRETMRERISASPLRDETEFLRALESAYREMWRHWCDT